jgi:hypothetical protein
MFRLLAEAWAVFLHFAGGDDRQLGGTFSKTLGGLVGLNFPCTDVKQASSGQCFRQTTVQCILKRPDFVEELLKSTSFALHHSVETYTLIQIHHQKICNLKAS